MINSNKSKKDSKKDVSRTATTDLKAGSAKGSKDLNADELDLDTLERLTSPDADSSAEKDAASKANAKDDSSVPVSVLEDSASDKNSAQSTDAATTADKTTDDSKETDTTVETQAAAEAVSASAASAASDSNAVESAAGTDAVVSEHKAPVSVTMDLDEEPRLKVYDEQGSETLAVEDNSVVTGDAVPTETTAVAADADAAEASAAEASTADVAPSEMAGAAETPSEVSAGGHATDIAMTAAAKAAAPKMMEGGTGNSRILADGMMTVQGTTAIQGLDQRKVISHHNVSINKDLTPEEQAKIQEIANLNSRNRKKQKRPSAAMISAAAAQNTGTLDTGAPTATDVPAAEASASVSVPVSEADIQGAYATDIAMTAAAKAAAPKMQEGGANNSHILADGMMTAQGTTAIQGLDQRRVISHHDVSINKALTPEELAKIQEISRLNSRNRQKRQRPSDAMIRGVNPQPTEGVIGGGAALTGAGESAGQDKGVHIMSDGQMMEEGHTVIMGLEHRDTAANTAVSSSAAADTGTAGTGVAGAGAAASGSGQGAGARIMDDAQVMAEGHTAIIGLGSRQVAAAPGVSTRIIGVTQEELDKIQEINELNARNRTRRARFEARFHAEIAAEKERASQELAAGNSSDVPGYVLPHSHEANMATASTVIAAGEAGSGNGLESVSNETVGSSGAAVGRMMPDETDEQGTSTIIYGSAAASYQNNMQDNSKHGSSSSALARLHHAISVDQQAFDHEIQQDHGAALDSQDGAFSGAAASLTAAGDVDSALAAGDGTNYSSVLGSAFDDDVADTMAVSSFSANQDDISGDTVAGIAGSADQDVIAGVAVVADAAASGRKSGAGRGVGGERSLTGMSPLADAALESLKEVSADEINALSQQNMELDAEVELAKDSYYDPSAPTVTLNADGTEVQPEPEPEMQPGTGGMAMDDGYAGLVGEVPPQLREQMAARYQYAGYEDGEIPARPVEPDGGEEVDDGPHYVVGPQSATNNVRNQQRKHAAPARSEPSVYEEAEEEVDDGPVYAGTYAEKLAQEQKRRQQRQKEQQYSANARMAVPARGVSAMAAPEAGLAVADDGTYAEMPQKADPSAMMATDMADPAVLEGMDAAAATAAAVAAAVSADAVGAEAVVAGAGVGISADELADCHTGPEPAGMDDGVLVNQSQAPKAQEDSGPYYVVGPAKKKKLPVNEPDDVPIYAVGVERTNAEVEAKIQAARSRIQEERALPPSYLDHELGEGANAESDSTEDKAYEQALAEAARESMAAPQSETVKRARRLAAEAAAGSRKERGTTAGDSEAVTKGAVGAGDGAADLKNAHNTGASFAEELDDVEYEDDFSEDQKEEGRKRLRTDSDGRYNFANMPETEHIRVSMVLFLYCRQLIASFFTYTTLPVIAPRLAMRFGPCYPSSMAIPFLFVGLLTGFVGGGIKAFTSLGGGNNIGSLVCLVYILLTGLTAFRGIYRIMAFINRRRHDAIMLIASVMVPLMVFMWLSNTLIAYTSGIVETAVAFGVATMLSAATASSLTWNLPQDPMDSCGAMTTKGLLFVIWLCIIASFGLLHYIVGLSVLGVSIVMRLIFGYSIVHNQGTAQRSYVYALQLITLFAIMLDLILLKSQNYEFLSVSTLEFIQYLRSYGSAFY